MLRGSLNYLGCTSGRIFQRKVNLYWIFMTEDLGDRLEGVGACLLASSKNTVADLQLADGFRPVICGNRRALSKAAVWSHGRGRGRVSASEAGEASGDKAGAGGTDPGAYAASGEAPASCPKRSERSSSVRSLVSKRLPLPLRLSSVVRPVTTSWAVRAAIAPPNTINP